MNGKNNKSAGPRGYVDFDLEIGVRSGRRKYHVTARSSEGEVEGEMRFPFDEYQLNDKLKEIEVAVTHSGESRRGLTTEEQTLQEFGRGLFDALMSDDIRSRYEVNLREARKQNKGLRLKLHVQPPELSTLPWEFLYDPNRDYLCLSSMTPVMRYMNLPQTVEPLRVSPPLKILGMVASPLGLPQLEIEHEKRLVQEAVKDLLTDRLVEITWLEGQTWRDLKREMRRGEWHVFHFIGHGGFVPETGEGAIALADEEGRKHLLGATALARLLDDHYPLRMVFLNSCEGAKGNPRDPFSSTAATLVRSGIPAVVAMQYEITDRAAVEFSRDFYEALADGLPVDAAVADARESVSICFEESLEWGTPVLYMRSMDGRIFDIASRAILNRQDKGHEAYRRDLALCWQDGQLSHAEVERLAALKKDLKLNSSVAASIEREVLGDTIEGILEIAHNYYARALSVGWGERKAADLRYLANEMPRAAFATFDRLATDTTLTPSAVVNDLHSMANELGLGEEQAVRTEREVLGAPLEHKLYEKPDDLPDGHPQELPP